MLDAAVEETHRCAVVPGFGARARIEADLLARQSSDGKLLAAAAAYHAAKLTAKACDERRTEMEKALNVMDRECAKASRRVDETRAALDAAVAKTAGAGS